ncbi:3-oxoacyl-[acyl-carrier-protein] reductase FabG [Chlorella vulgaris]
MSLCAANGRLARLRGHLDVDTSPTWQPEISSAADGGLAAATTSGKSDGGAQPAHKKCYNFEPGRLLLDQVAIITGAGGGIGRATAILFAQQGAKVVVSDLDASKADATADFIRNSCGTALSVPGDVTDPCFPPKVVAAAVAAYGGLHILVNNAGYTWDGMLHKQSEKQWEAMLAAASPHMRDAAKRELEQQGRPHPRCILNVSSVSGMHGSVGQVNYGTAKAGVVGLTKSVAKEWGPLGIRCNALTFGYINTRLVQSKEKGASIEVAGQQVPLGIPQASGVAAAMKQMIALGRVGAPEEAAGAMLLLASPYASYITGQALEVTGGGWM